MDATGEAKAPPLWVAFDRPLKLKFHGTSITSAGGRFAEMAVSRAPFAKILRRIDRLRGSPRTGDLIRADCTVAEAERRAVRRRTGSAATPPRPGRRVEANSPPSPTAPLEP